MSFGEKFKLNPRYADTWPEKTVNAAAKAPNPSSFIEEFLGESARLSEQPSNEVASVTHDDSNLA